MRFIMHLPKHSPSRKTISLLNSYYKKKNDGILFGVYYMNIFRSSVDWERDGFVTPVKDQVIENNVNLLTSSLFFCCLD